MRTKLKKNFYQNIYFDVVSWVNLVSIKKIKNKTLEIEGFFPLLV